LCAEYLPPSFGEKVAGAPVAIECFLNPYTDRAALLLCVFEHNFLFDRLGIIDIQNNNKSKVTVS
jgi:hypothetical protein